MRGGQAAALACRQVVPGGCVRVRVMRGQACVYVWYMQSFTEGCKKETDA